MGEWSDSLTGLDSAPFFREHVQGLLARRPEKFQPFLYGVSRISKFDEVIKSKSVSFGDALIASAAHSAREIVRGGDRVGRLGRDHFGFALLASSEEEASACEIRFRRSLASHFFADLEYEILFAFIWVAEVGKKLSDIDYEIDLLF